ncbi:Glycogen synthase [Serratia entomophila]|uniref:glycosyltransferase n=1 Tax=Serratia entomophila TaxID=42906 RepID=UPI001F40A72E|nr:glycosyltransferase [Serratia entomophila]UIW19911.1 glycosyltransferase [Serratia entomophila]CAI0773513.1 Glycogen synthase [Serratia entomophila]CAI0778006.1 Glycogen synthase [Serratia entomophila]CAI0782438.1 Glycogen synthase [Serratia entomophila]CAI0809228.1 Glycogen synthase [Serratia entomophila]
MRIDYVITGLEIGGAEYQVVALLEQLAQRGHQLRLISLTPPSSAVFIDRLAAAGIPLCSLGMRSGKDLPRALLRLRKELLRSRPDVVHSHMVHANLLTRLVRLLMPSLKIVCTAHNTHEGGKLRDWAYRLTNPLSQMNTTISEAATRRFTGEKVFPTSNTRTIPNGIDTDKFAPGDIREDHIGPFRWLAVGRLVEQKDYPTLISAFSRLPDSRLLIAGKGPLLEALQLQVKQAGLKERVEFLGVRDNIDKLYRQVDGFVLSSEWEGYGLVVAEAMASELPVVVTDSGGPGEIIGSEGINGLLVPIKNPDALAQAMARIESMPPLERQNLGRAARQRVKDKFSLNQIVTQWEHVYAELKNNN